MAHIDNLIAAIKDPQLRAALHAEYDKVTKIRQFGLVFDRHQPESVVLPGFTIRGGEKVQVLLENTQDQTAVDGSGIWTISSISRDGGQAQLRDSDGNTCTEPLDRLVATREFGDPIYPGLRSTGRVLRGGGVKGAAGDKPFHAIINAENYHALEALLYPYEGKVDAIYIDPPYNTGARDWKYNNDYIDDNDPYRHSKWLSFMEKRLQIAKRLLNPARSVLVVTIDQKEVHRLGLLLEQVFPGSSRQMVTIVINPNGVARKREMARVEEYAFFIFLGDAGPVANTDSYLGDAPTDRAGRVRWEWLLRGGTNSRRVDRPNLFYPIFLDPEQRTVVEVGECLPLTTLRSSVADRPGLVTVWPLRINGDEGNWRASPAYFRALLAAGHARVGAYDRQNDRYSMLYLGKAQIRRIESGELVVTGRDPSGAVTLSSSSTTNNRVTAKTVWNRSGHKAGEYGSALLKRFVPDRAFPFPKALYAVEDTLRVMVGDNPTALVVDFFGGSGTTTHAVARLNQEDGGRRRSITITNNEVSVEEANDLRSRGIYPGTPEWEALGICQHITIPRVSAAFTGYTYRDEAVKGDYAFGEKFPMSEGLDENVEFFGLTYQDPALVSLGRRFEAIAPMLWLKSGAVGTRIDKIDPLGWSIPVDATYGILFDTSSWPSFVDAVAARGGSAMPIAQLFIVTDSLVEFQQVVSRLDQSLEITRLYADYLRSFEINTPR